MARDRKPKEAAPLVIARPRKKLVDMTDKELDDWADALYERMVANYEAARRRR